MLILKALFLYCFLFGVSLLLILKTDLNNPAIAFFIPSIFAMCFLAKMKFKDPKSDSFKLALFSGLFFAGLTVVLSWIMQVQFKWINHSPQLLHFMAFCGNLLFPFMIFPKIKNAQNL